MRRKVAKTVMTFASTADAMAMEAAARARGIPGRIIPVPSEISAGCGLAWCVSADQRDQLLEWAHALGLAFQDVHEVAMY